jgi:hypothetical protein
MILYHWYVTRAGNTVHKKHINQYKYNSTFVFI